jgi:hypothetical protein
MTDFTDPTESAPEAQPPTTVDLLKKARQDHETAEAYVRQLEGNLKDARHKMFAVRDQMTKLAKQLLEEQLGSTYEARVVLYHLIGKWT